MKTLKLKFVNNQITILTKNQFGLFFQNTKFIILFSIFLALNILLNIFGFLIINYQLADFDSEQKLNYINFIIILTSVLLIIQTIYITVNCFITQIKNNIHTTEIRYGYKVKNIYWARLFFVFGFSVIFLLAMFLFSSIFFALGVTHDSFQSVYLYRLYISSFAWYGILFFLTIVITLVLAKFLSESSTSIVASIMAIFFLLFPFITSIIFEFSENEELSRYGSIALLTENYRREFYHDLQDDETFKLIYPEFEYVSNLSSSSRKKEIILGPRFWKVDQSKIENYNKFYEKVNQVLRDDHQITTWDTFFEIASDRKNSKYDEPFHQLFTKLSSDQRLQEYNYLFKVMEKQTKNFPILKELLIIEMPPVNNSGENETVKKFGEFCDEYFFIKTLNSLFLRICTPSTISQENLNNFRYAEDPITIEEIKTQIKRDRFANIFNPLRHFNLMFNAIDYRDNPLYSNINGDHFVCGGITNYDFDLDGDISDLNSSLKLKQNVPVENIYLFYFALGSILIGLSYLRFNKKSKN